MNRHDAKRLWPIMKAFAEGAEIERYDAQNQEWVHAQSPTFVPEFSWRKKTKDAPAEVVMWVHDNGTVIAPSSFIEAGKRQGVHTTKLFREVTE